MAVDVFPQCHSIPHPVPTCVCVCVVNAPVLPESLRQSSANAMHRTGSSHSQSRAVRFKEATPRDAGQDGGDTGSDSDASQPRSAAQARAEALRRAQRNQPSSGGGSRQGQRRRSGGSTGSGELDARDPEAQALLAKQRRYAEYQQRQLERHQQQYDRS